MNFAGFAVTSPLSAAAMVDQLRWRVVVYADTPRAIAIFHKEMAVTSDRRVVVFVLGAHLLNKVVAHKNVATCFVFDDVVNLASVAEQMPQFPLVDVDTTNGGRLPKPPTPQEINDALTAHKVHVTEGLFLRVAQVLTQRPPSVLETTNRMPPVHPPHAVSGVQGLMMDLRLLLEGNDKVPFASAVDYLCKLTFGMVKRATVTANVTKRLPPEASLLWGDVLSIVCSPVGEQMARAFQFLCASDDVNVRIHNAVKRFNLEASYGDFTYMTAVFPPSKSHVFVTAFLDEPSKFTGTVPVTATPEVVVKSKAKKARAKR